MDEMTPLDLAHTAMEGDVQDDAARLRFYERLADSELFLMLSEELKDGADNVTPEVFDLGTSRYVLVFDREDRLAAFSGGVTPYVSLSGRAITQMLAGQDIGLGLNLEVAPSSILLPPDAISWLNETLGNSPDELDAKVTEVRPPHGLPEQLIAAIDTKLATAMGLANAAYIVSTTYEHGGQGHMLAFVEAIPEAQGALARAASEALTFSTIEAGAMDVAFFRASDPIVEKLERVGLRFDLPQLQEPVTQTLPTPGMDPEKPPKLK